MDVFLLVIFFWIKKTTEFEFITIKKCAIQVII